MKIYYCHEVSQKQICDMHVVICYRALPSVTTSSALHCPPTCRCHYNRGYLNLWFCNSISFHLYFISFTHIICCVAYEDSHPRTNVQTCCFDLILCFCESFLCNWQTPFPIHARCLWQIREEWRNSDTGQPTLVETYLCHGLQSSWSLVWKSNIWCHRTIVVSDFCCQAIMTGMWNSKKGKTEAIQLNVLKTLIYKKYATCSQALFSDNMP
jgi:hypothetical protein